MGEHVLGVNMFERVRQHKQLYFYLVGVMPKNVFKRVHRPNVFTPTRHIPLATHKSWDMSLDIKTERTA